MYFLQYFYCYDNILDFDFVYASILSVFIAAEYILEQLAVVQLTC